MKQFIYILLCSPLLLFSCKDSKLIHVEGKLSNFNEKTLFAVYESPDGNKVDTLTSDDKGKFTAIHEMNEDITSIIFYYDNHDKWFTVYPTAKGKILVTGDAEYPKLLSIKGGSLNDKLSLFRRKSAEMLKEETDLFKQQKENPNNSTQLANLRHDIRLSAQDFIKSNPQEQASAVLIDEYFAHSDNLEHAEELVRGLSADLEDFHVVKNLKQRINKAKSTNIGEKAPEYSLTNIHGKKITPQYFSNKNYILAFTSFWCDMCQTDVMMLDGISSTHSRDSLEILLISLDEDVKEVREMLKNDTIQWNLVTDSAGQAIDLFDKYNVSILPTCYLIDKEGFIRLKTSNSIELQQSIDKLYTENNAR